MLLAKWILWELYALDHVMAMELWASSFTECHALLHSIFPSDSGLLMWDDSLLKQDSNLWLSAGSWKELCPWVDKFQELLSVWHDAPSHLSLPLGDPVADCDNQVAHLTMQSTTNFYVQTFFDHFSRLPVIPHVYPFG
ncbi:hypothetical protein PAXRUDRAFT_158640 [Paxillus rubicundulus Ve08.2h10]|uniref:Uncharacterized protein n=1 Tax=Paxillus rubicundulus Ve08.2h10 TaxID=930991 RepID=A0A0D0D9M3_9AGAM|nr:hypothetical protein PAXRUDRAFT_158640 [Paxillus rubicundulus Ve08.2h10]